VEQFRECDLRVTIPNSIKAFMTLIDCGYCYIRVNAHTTSRNNRLT